MGGFDMPRAEWLYYRCALDSIEDARSSEPARSRRGVVGAYVFTTMALEAFINREYDDRRQTSAWSEHMDRLPLQARWLALPTLLGSTGSFDKGREPWQSFQELLKIRNDRLVHFKPREETRHSRLSFKPDSYFLDLLEDVARAERMVACAPAMVAELHRLTNGQTADPDKFRHAGEQGYVATIASDGRG